MLALAVATLLAQSAVGSRTATVAPKAAIAAAVADPQRDPRNRLRDRYRHPAETLRFFGITPTRTVVEYQPGGGWYTEILAPLLGARGRYIALGSAGAEDERSLREMVARGGRRYGRVTIATIDEASGSSSVPDASIDVVLTFRNVHNLVMAGDGVAVATLRGFHRMLKPGGTLGIVDHRLPESFDSAMETRSGYIKRSTVIRVAQAAGFRLVGESMVNANPNDLHDWPKGVWSLPPALAGEPRDRDKFLAIGESDRMTLKFVK